MIEGDPLADGSRQPSYAPAVGNVRIIRRSGRSQFLYLLFIIIIIFIYLFILILYILCSAVRSRSRSDRAARLHRPGGAGGGRRPHQEQQSPSTRRARAGCTLLSSSALCTHRSIDGMVCNARRFRPQRGGRKTKGGHVQTNNLKKTKNPVPSVFLAAFVCPSRFDLLPGPKRDTRPADRGIDRGLSTIIDREARPGHRSADFDPPNESACNRRNVPYHPISTARTLLLVPRSKKAKGRLDRAANPSHLQSRPGVDSIDQSPNYTFRMHSGKLPGLVT